MSDIRKRVGRKGKVTYQVRYPSKSTKSGYAYATFATRKEALAFVEGGRARNTSSVTDASVRKIGEAIDRWLDICEKEGTDGNEPVTEYTLKNYRYYAEFMRAYPWAKDLPELLPPDIVEFRSWLMTNCPSRYVARKTLTYFHSVLNEMALRGHIAANVASGISISSSSRYQQPIMPPTEKEFHGLLAAADRLANSKNRQIAKAWARYRPMVYLAGDTGMRPGEYLALSLPKGFPNGKYRLISSPSQSEPLRRAPHTLVGSPTRASQVRAAIAAAAAAEASGALGGVASRRPGWYRPRQR